MEPMMSSMASAYYYNNPEAMARSHGHFMAHPQQMPVYAMVPTLPSSPVYSRPNSSCSQQPMMRSVTSVPANLMTPMPSPPTHAAHIVNGHLMHRPSMLLETSDLCPSTPPLSASSASSPGSCDKLITPLNPMFSGFDSSFASLKGVSAEEAAVEHHLPLTGWSSCSSPPLTPVFIHPQPHQLASMPHGMPMHSDLLSVSACPSLSPSPSPYPRSVTSEQDNDFCDPRTLTVSSVDSGLSPVDFSGLPSLCVSEEEDLSPKPEPESPGEQSALAMPAPLEFDSSIVPPLEDFPELEAEEDFLSGLVHLGDLSATSMTSPSADDLASRSRASSAISANSDFECDRFFDTWESTSPVKTESDHPSKRHRTESGSMPVAAFASESSSPSNSAEVQAAATEEQAATSDNGSQSSASTGSDSPQNYEGSSSQSAPVPTNRRGRKQSLTEDPSKIFACDLCNRRFRRQEHLKRHYRSLHTQDKPFSCQECGKKFSRSDNLAQHARTHGAGAFVMNLYDDPDIVAAATGGYPHGMYAPHNMAVSEDYSTMGRVLFQVASEIPGSASEVSSDDASDGQKKKRKRSE